MATEVTLKEAWMTSYNNGNGVEVDNKDKVTTITVPKSMEVKFSPGFRVSFNESDIVGGLSIDSNALNLKVTSSNGIEWSDNDNNYSTNGSVFSGDALRIRASREGTIQFDFYVSDITGEDNDCLDAELSGNGKASVTINVKIVDNQTIDGLDICYKASSREELLGKLPEGCTCNFGPIKDNGLRMPRCAKWPVYKGTAIQQIYVFDTTEGSSDGTRVSVAEGSWGSNPKGQKDPWMLVLRHADNKVFLLTMPSSATGSTVKAISDDVATVSSTSGSPNGKIKIKIKRD